MPHIVITMKDGTKKDYPAESRPGGSWENSVKSANGFVIYRDVWGTETWWPVEDVKEILIGH